MSGESFEMEIVRLCTDMDRVAELVARLGGTMEEQVMASMCAARLLDLHDIEMSGDGYWVNGNFIASYKDINEQNKS